MAIIQNVTLLAIVLVGAALLREREHVTVEHLLVMPVRPAEIMIAKIWANGLVVVLAATASLWFVVHEFLGVPLVTVMAQFQLPQPVLRLTSRRGTSPPLAKSLPRHRPHSGRCCLQR